MTLTPWDLAFAAMAAPEPESRFTSSSTFAPFVIACSACCCCVDLSPSAFEIVTGTPAASKAFFRNGRSTVSQRTDDFESGSRTATLPLSPPPPPPPAAPLVPPLSSSPQPTKTSAPVAAISAAISHARYRMGFLLLDGFSGGWGLSRGLRREARGEGAVGFAHHERDRTQDLCPVAEHAGDHPGRFRGRRQRRLGDRLPYTVEQQVTGCREVSSDHEQLRIQDVEQHRRGPADGPARVGDHPATPEVAPTGEL